MDNSLIIKAENLTFSYDDTEPNTLGERPSVLKNVSFSVKHGEYVAILGHNGSGKSTLAKLLNMILIPDSGKIYIDGQDITSDSFTEDDLFDVRRKIGMVFQNPDNQLVATVVEEDVAFGPENLGLPREVIRERIDNALKLVNMTEYAHHAPHKLSGGQKQRVAIAGIIAMRPEVIIFDESTAMLDPLGRKEVVEIMERLNREEGITVLNITHYMSEAARADRVIVMNDGEIIGDGSAKQIFSRPDMLHKVDLESTQAAELINILSKDFKIVKGAIFEDECVKDILSLIESEVR